MEQGCRRWKISMQNNAFPYFYPQELSTGIRRSCYTAAYCVDWKNAEPAAWMSNKTRQIPASKPSEVVVTAADLFSLYDDTRQESSSTVDVRAVMNLLEQPQYYQGKFDLWSPSAGCLVAVLDFDVSKDFSTTTPLENFFTLEIILQGNCEIQLGSRNLCNNGLPRIYLTSHGLQSSKRRVHEKGDSYRSIGIWIAPRDFLENFGVIVDDLPGDIQAVLTSPDSGVITLPMTSPIKQVANDFIEAPFSGKRADQYLRAKFTELLCHIAELANTPSSHIVEEMALPRSKSNIMKKTLLALEQSRFLSLSLSEIANELGLCQSTLSSVFKEGYGMKLSEYLLQRRMETARALLQAGRLSVLEVALEVGYENQSSFGRVYRQYFNHTPREDMPGV